MSPDSNKLSQSDQNVALYIDGSSVSGERRFPVISPVNDKEIWTCSSANVSHADHAVEAAKAAFGTWAATNPRSRSEVLFRAADLFLQRREELEKYMKLETAADDDFIGFNIEATVKQLKDVANRVTAI